ncbi:hypothetical protein GGF32_004338 [Allomyces javanicus]|nr:hypothetical protein GGF32_004338 [Allomyces javanicus]
MPSLLSGLLRSRSKSTGNVLARVNHDVPTNLKRSGTKSKRDAGTTSAASLECATDPPSTADLLPLPTSCLTDLCAAGAAALKYPATLNMTAASLASGSSSSTAPASASTTPNWAAADAAKVISMRIAAAGTLNAPADHLGNTPLHLAIMHRDMALALLLLRKGGADPNVANAAGASPLDVAEALAWPAMANALVRYGARINNAAPRPNLLPHELMGATASPTAMAVHGLTWHLAPLTEPGRVPTNVVIDIPALARITAAYGHTELARALVPRLMGPPSLVDAPDAHGMSPLAWAALGGSLDIVRLLVEEARVSVHGAPGYPRMAPLHLAAFGGHLEIVAYLMERGAVPTERDLMVAAWMLHFPIVDHLLKVGKVAIPQPFFTWLRRGWDLRRQVNEAFTWYQPAPGPTTGSLTSASVIASGAELEVERLLTIASPESAMSARALVKSVPTKIAKQTAQDANAELDAGAGQAVAWIQWRSPVLFRHNPIAPPAAPPLAELVPDLVTVALGLEGDLQVAFTTVLYRLPMRGSDLDVDVARFALHVLHLIRHAAATDKTQYTATAVLAASTVQKLCSRILGEQMPTAVAAAVADQCRRVQEESAPGLLRAARLASGIWPPPTAVPDMVREAMAVLDAVEDLVRIANVSGCWPAGTLNMTDLVRHLWHGKHHPLGGSRPVSGSGIAAKDFDEYRREANLQKIESMARTPPQERTEADAMASAAPTSVPTSPVAAPSDEDAPFFADLDAAVGLLAARVKDLRAAVQRSAKDEYRACAAAVYAALDRVAEDVLAYRVIRDMSHDLTTHDGSVTLSAALADDIAKARAAGAGVLQRAHVASGVWPPEGAAQTMLDTTVPCLLAVKKVVMRAREIVPRVRVVKGVEIDHALELQERWMHGERIRAMVRLWENVQLAAVPMPAGSRIVRPAGGEVGLEKPSAATLLRETEELYADDGLVFDDGKQVRGGRLAKLVEVLTHQSYKDYKYAKTFLLTHHSFTTSLDLLALLIRRYDVPPPMGIDDEEAFNRYVQRCLMPVRGRVLDVLTQWIKSHFADFLSDDKALYVKINEFLKSKVSPDLPNRVEQIFSVLKTQMQESQNTDPVVDLKLAPKPVINTKHLPKLETRPAMTTALLDQEATEIARQLTLLEAKHFRAIVTKEWVNQIWGRTNETSRTKAPTIDVMITLTNRLSRTVAHMVVASEVEKERLAVIKHWVHVAQACAALNNFNAVTAIVAGLCMGPVHRMEKTWAVFATKHPKSREALTRLTEVVSASGQYANYRKALKAATKPCIPFLGVYITDLTFVEDGNPDFLPENHHINFDKRRKVATIIEEIVDWQHGCVYGLLPADALLAYLRDLPLGDVTEKDLYSMSVKAEPIEDDGDDD